MIEEWIEEFLYRGRPPSGPDSEKDPALHVVIGQQIDDPFGGTGKQRQLLSPMSIADAETIGWSLPSILSSIADATLKELETAKLRIAELEAEVTTLKTV